MSYQEVLEWTSSEVVQYLQSLKLGQYGNIFLNNDINGEAFLFLTKKHLKQMGINLLGHRLTIIQSIQKIKNNENNLPKAKIQQKVTQFSRTTRKQIIETENEPIQKIINSSKSPSDDSDGYQSSGTNYSDKRRRDISQKSQFKYQSTNHSEFTSEEDTPSPIYNPQSSATNRIAARQTTRQKAIIEVNDDDEDLYNAVPPPGHSRLQNSRVFIQSNENQNEKPLKPTSSQGLFTNVSRPTNHHNPPQQASKPLPEHEDFSDNDYYNIPPASKSIFGQQKKTTNFEDEDEGTDEYDFKPTPKSTYQRISRNGPQQTSQNYKRTNMYSDNEKSENEEEDFYENLEANSRPLTTGKEFPPSSEDREVERVECRFCHRKFAKNRISVHEKCCSAAPGRHKKHVFDSKQMRIGGSEAAKLYDPNAPDPTLKKKKNFRAEHEKLMNQLRAARGVGNSSEVQMTYEEVDERVPCPYCGRKFAPETAERHIAICERTSRGRQARMAPPNKFGRK